MIRWLYKFKPINTTMYEKKSDIFYKEKQPSLIWKKNISYVDVCLVWLHFFQKSRRNFEKSRRNFGKARRNFGKARRKFEKARRKLRKARRNFGKARRKFGKARRKFGKARQIFGKARQNLKGTRARHDIERHAGTPKFLGTPGTRARHLADSQP